MLRRQLRNFELNNLFLGSVYKAPKPKGQQQQQQHKSVPPHLVSLPVTAPAPAPTPVTATPVLSSNGIHPDRLKFHESSKPAGSNKRSREEAAALLLPVINVVPEVVLKEKKSKKDKKDKNVAEEQAAESIAALPVPLELASDEPRKKKSKKEVKQEKFAKKTDVAPSAGAIVEAFESTTLATPASPVTKTKSAPTPTTVHPPFALSTLSKPYTVPALLHALFPTLLSSPTSIADILTTVQAEAKKAGFLDEKAVTDAFMEGLWLGGASLKKIKTLTMKF